MKRKLLLPLLLLALLCSCNDKGTGFDPAGDEGQGGTPGDASGESGGKDDGGTSGGESGGESGGDTGGEGEGGSEKETYTYTVSFNTTNTMNTDKRDTFHTKLKEYINSEKEVIASVNSVDYVQIGKFDQRETSNNDDLYSIYALVLGGASKDGTLILNFVDTLKEVKINAQAYYKYYWDYKTNQAAISVDESNVLKVSGSVWDLTLTDKTKAGPKEDKTFVIGSKQLKLESETANRVFIHSMTFTFEK